MNQAVILAGGKGTRLADRLDGLPKALVDVGGKPLLERQLDHLKQYGVTDVILLVNYSAAAIADFVSARQTKADIRVRLVDDGEPRGTAGAALAALDRLDGRFFVVYGDTLINVDLRTFSNAHLRADADATLFLHPNDHPQDSDIVEIDDDSWVKAFRPYPHPPGAYLPNLVNAALYIVERRALLPFHNLPAPCDFGRNLFPAMLATGAKILGYPSFEYVKDLGTPKRLEKVERDLRTGVVARASLSEPQKTVFVDRDGTLNIHRGLITDADELELLPGVAQGIRCLNENEFRVAVLTNQPVIARGDASYARLRQIHAKLETLLGREGAYLDCLYFCPHHPDSGYAGEIPALKIDCECRKPKIGLVERAAKALNTDFSRSWVIGDSWRDIEMAARAGLRSVLVTTGEAGSGNIAAEPNFVRQSFRDAVDTIIRESERRK